MVVAFDPYCLDIRQVQYRIDYIFACSNGTCRPCRALRFDPFLGDKRSGDSLCSLNVATLCAASNFFFFLGDVVQYLCAETYVGLYLFLQRIGVSLGPNSFLAPL